MADVFLAVAEGPAGSGFAKLAVIKRLRESLVDDPEFVAMLVDEARIAARLNHPNVVQTNEVGHVGNEYFIAMEYLDGQPLHRIVHRAKEHAAEQPGEPPAFDSSLLYLAVADAAAGLHHAHGLADYDGTPLQIVHRDVTPQNIFVTYAGQVKVVDFGIAKAAGRASETKQGVVKGKVRYMAPEQALGVDVDRRADVYALGVMLWEAAVGRRMWADLDEMTVTQRLLLGEIPTSPRSVVPDVPEAIDRICCKALAYKREERHASADEVRAEIEQYLADAGLLVEARRKLGGAVATLFADKRAAIKVVIEKQLALLDTRTSAVARIEHSTSPSAMTLSLEEPTQTATETETEQETALYARGGRLSRLTRGALTVALASAVLGLAGWLATQRMNLPRAEAAALVRAQAPAGETPAPTAEAPIVTLAAFEAAPTPTAPLAANASSSPATAAPSGAPSPRAHWAQPPVTKKAPPRSTAPSPARSSTPPPVDPTRRARRSIDSGDPWAQTTH
jgi:serine/threonine-protein kinase